MEPCRRALATLLLLLLVAFEGSKVAIISVRAADGICNMTTHGLEACKPAMSCPAPTDPSPECCEALANADLPCLCSFWNSFQLLPAFGIDRDLAMQLPAKCNLTAPAQCRLS